ncbi:MAG TPA: ABC transporter substrate-binding protein [Propionicimonas sp.]|jgi:iron complex transport system substrate-binding protein|nr:ABC transporter substrate-binding protein [Propionicimonas sp.]
MSFLTKPGRVLRAVLLPAVALPLLLGGCSSAAPAAAPTSAGAPASSQSPAASGWSYTDDTGATVTLDHMPARVAGFTDQALSLFSYGLKPVAVFGRTDVATDTRFGGYDMTDVAITGNTYGEIDLEALAAAQPDLIVTGIYPADREGAIDPAEPYYGFKDLEQQQKLAAIAPIVAIKVGGAGLDVIESNTKLALALGADQARVDADRAAFETASANLTKVAEAKGLTVSAMYADADGIYLVKPKDEPETQLYQALGVDYTELNPDGPYYWDIFSWENAGKVKVADVILLSNEGFQQADLLKQATFADDPALQAGQVFERRVSPMDYSSQAKNLDVLADQLEQSQKVT